jgi:hypothetical protein
MNEPRCNSGREQEEARQRLVEIYGWFSEGFDTMDLREAKVLLAALPGKISSS